MAAAAEEPAEPKEQEAATAENAAAAEEPVAPKEAAAEEPKASGSGC